jgi:serine/threonine-protein kinase
MKHLQSPPEDERLVRLSREDELRYHHISTIAKGGVGRVHLATDIVQNKQVIIKDARHITEIEYALIEREGEHLKLLQHPGIVLYQGSGKHPTNGPYVIEEYVRGGSLDHEFGLPVPVEHTTLDYERIVRTSLRMCFALKHAHERGVLHLDMQPQNVLMREEQPVVIDWGFSLHVNENAPNEDIMGTDNYMAPEIGNGSPLTAKADVFGTGAVLYEMLTHEPPFSTEQPKYRHRPGLAAEAPVKKINPTVPDEIAAICEAALEKSVKRRPTLDTIIKNLRQTMEKLLK